MSSLLADAFPEPPRLVVRRQRAGTLRAYHPWVFSGALLKPPKNLPSGLIVDLVDEHGGFLARGSYSHLSQILVRVLTFQDEPVDDSLLRRRVREAVARRDGQIPPETDAWRLIFAEADRLPGLIVDRYGDWLVVQILTAGMEPWREVVVDELSKLPVEGIYERSDHEDRRRYEGLELRSGPLLGPAPPDELVIREHGHRFRVDPRAGHKTGFYLDQRENRRTVARYATGRRVLNAFAYTGGFGVYAAAAGAQEVIHVDGSAPALELCRRNLGLNGLTAGQSYVEANVFDLLRDHRAAGERFDLIILDPPKFAASKKQLDNATRGYRSLNAGALKLLSEGGYLATFSCSGAVDAGLFQRILGEAAADAGRQVQFVEVLGQPADHPVLAAFPEGQYLTGLIGRVLD